MTKSIGESGDLIRGLIIIEEPWHMRGFYRAACNADVV